MHNLIEKKVIAPKDPSLAQQLYEDFLVDKYQPQETRIKLKPVKNDSKAFGKLFDDSSEHIQKSNLTVNYNYFYDRIQRGEISIDEFPETPAAQTVPLKKAAWKPEAASSVWLPTNSGNSLCGKMCFT